MNPYDRSAVFGSWRRSPPASWSCSDRVSWLPPPAPSRRTSGIGRRVRLSELAEELTYVARQQVGSFHGGEVAAALELGPMHDVVVAIRKRPDGEVAREHRHPSGHRGAYSGLAPAAGA